MKTLLIASMIGSGVFLAAPALQTQQFPTRKPFSWHGPINTPLPRLASDFVLTDVVVDGGVGFQTVAVDVGGQTVATLRTSIDASLVVGWNQATYYGVEPLRLMSGIPIASGAVVTVTGTTGNVTVSGYYQ
jgi:hypothetical protein